MREHDRAILGNMLIEQDAGSTPAQQPRAANLRQLRHAKGFAAAAESRRKALAPIVAPRVKRRTVAPSRRTMRRKPSCLIS